MKHLFIISSLLLGLTGCSGSSLVMDRSSEAMASDDMTLISSCQATPGSQIGLSSGVDSCRFTDGDTVAGNWIIIAPSPPNAKKVTGGTVDIYYRDLHKSYSVHDWVISIPFHEMLGINKWSKKFDEGVVEALVTVNWSDNAEIQQVTQYRGIAVIIVTAQGYTRMPIDSGNYSWGASCKVQYSTAGRSAVVCK